MFRARCLFASPLSLLVVLASSGKFWGFPKISQEEEGLVGREGGRERGREGGGREVGEDGGEGGKGGREGRDAYLDEVGVLVRVLLAFLLRL